jgi:putative DNA primase/helicase
MNAGDRTRPEDFKTFHGLLMAGAPDGYVPHYFKVGRRSKAPGVPKGTSWQADEARLTFDEAMRRLQNGGNVGLGALEDDTLANIDVDTPEHTDELRGLQVTSRSRIGRHAPYFIEGDLDVPNIVTDDKGEVRTVGEYVVAPGSYVPIDDDDREEIREEHGRDVLESVTADPDIGVYTVEVEEPAGRLTGLDELPQPHREAYIAGQAPAATVADTVDSTLDSYNPDDGTGDRSAFFELTLTDVLPANVRSADASDRVSAKEINGLHGSTSDSNIAYDSSKGVIHCWRHLVALGTQQLLAVQSGHLSCKDAGVAHKNSSAGPSKYKGDDEALFHAWLEAKRRGLLPDDDREPYRVLCYLARENELATADEIPPRGSDPTDDDSQSLPIAGYNGALSVLDHELDIAPVRDTVPISSGASDDGTAEADGGTATAAGKAVAEAESEPNADGDGDDGAENDPWAQVRALYADDESENDKLAMNRAVRRLREEINVATHDEAEALYSYDPGDGTYHRNGEHRVQEHLYGEDKLGGVFYPARARNIIETLKYTTYTPEDEFGSPDDRICLANGVLDTDDPADPVLEPHSPEHLFTSGHPVAYDPDASAPEFETFIEDAVRDEDRAKLQEYAGYCLHSWDQPYKKALMLVGPTNSGKGTFLRILEAVLGAESVSHETLEDLTDSRWSKAQLYDGVANIRNEMSTSRLKHVERFKEMTGRGDTMSAERKNEQKFDFTVTQKFLFATNEVPEVEADDAFNNRWLFASFPHTVPQHEIDADLADRIVENELSGVLNWALEGYARLREQGQFSDERDLDAKDEMWERYGSTVDRFKHACLMITGDSDDLLTKETVRELYKAFCARVGREPEAAQTVTKDLAADADISHGDRTLPGDRSQTDCYIGVQFNDAALDDLDYEPFDGGGGSGTDGNPHPGSQRTIDDHHRGTDTDPETDTGTSTEDDANIDGRGQDQDRDRSRDHLDGAPDSEVGAIIAQSGSKKTGVGLGAIENRVDADDETVAEELQRLKDKGLITEPYDERYRPAG